MKQAPRLLAGLLLHTVCQGAECILVGQPGRFVQLCRERFDHLSRAGRFGFRSQRGLRKRGVRRELEQLMQPLRHLVESIHRCAEEWRDAGQIEKDRKSTRLNSSHGSISYAVFCLKKESEGDRELS